MRSVGGHHFALNCIGVDYYEPSKAARARRGGLLPLPLGPATTKSVGTAPGAGRINPTFDRAAGFKLGSYVRLDLVAPILRESGDIGLRRGCIPALAHRADHIFDIRVLRLDYA